MWYKELSVITNQPRVADEGDVFAFRFHAWVRDDSTWMAKNNVVPYVVSAERSAMLAEYQRLQFDSTQWRISEANAQFG